MEMPVPCSGCGKWIELNDAIPCRLCRRHDAGRCRECADEHAEEHREGEPITPQEGS